jgi:hypothetical protein
MAAPASPIVERFRGRIDAAVAAARAAAVAGLVGRLACVAASAVVAVAALDLALRRPGFWAGGSVVAAVVAVAAWRLLAGFGRRFADRLRIARAFETAHPELGERVSRAVEFLDDLPDGSAARGSDRTVQATPTEPRRDGSHRPAVPEMSPVTRGLRSLALEQAAAAVDGLGRPPMPGLRAELLWCVTGLAAVAAVWAAAVARPQSWGIAVRRQLAPATAVRWPDRTLPSTPPGQPPASQTAAVPVPDATVSAWAQLESLRRQADAAAAAHAAGKPVPSAELRRLLRKVRDDSAAAAAGMPAGAAVLHAFALETGRVESLLAAGQDREADGLALLRRSLDRLSALATAAAGIADAAALEKRLASAVGDLFRRQPGVARGDLAPPARDAIDRIAVLQAESLAGIDADTETIRGWKPDAGADAAVENAVTQRLAAVTQRLEAVAGATPRESVADIEANRLARAAAAAAHAADRLAEAASLLGMPAFDIARDGSAARPASRAVRPLAELRRLQASADLATAAVGRTDTDGGPMVDAGRAPGDAGSPGAAGGRADEGEDSRSGGFAAGGPTSGGAEGAAAAGRPADGRSGSKALRPLSRQDRVWNLLPDRERPLGIAAADVPVPPSYREAVDAYFQSLLEATRPEDGAP